MFLSKNNRCVQISLSNDSQTNYATEVITIFCHKEKLYKEKVYGEISC